MSVRSNDETAASRASPCTIRGACHGRGGQRRGVVARTVRDLTRHSDLRFADRGTHALKGVPEDVAAPRPGLTAGEPAAPILTRPHGAWRSLVAHLLWEQGVAGSNPAAPIGPSVSGSRPLRKPDGLGRCCGRIGEHAVVAEAAHDAVGAAAAHVDRVASGRVLDVVEVIRAGSAEEGVVAEPADPVLPAARAANAAPFVPGPPGSSQRSRRGDRRTGRRRSARSPAARCRPRPPGRRRRCRRGRRGPGPWRVRQRRCRPSTRCRRRRTCRRRRDRPRCRPRAGRRAPCRSRTPGSGTRRSPRSRCTCRRHRRDRHRATNTPPPPRQ